jgi:thiol-disulfide isomerase/thioredoxin
MDDLYAGTHVIKLNDSDFEFEPIRLKNKLFKDKDGYIMIYASWCPNCQNKVDFWSLLAKQFNVKGQFAKENFRIGVINTGDPAATRIIDALNVTAIPRFMHVTPDSNGFGIMSDYQGADLAPETLLEAVCKTSPTKRLCQFKWHE